MIEALETFWSCSCICALGSDGLCKALPAHHDPYLADASPLGRQAPWLGALLPLAPLPLPRTPLPHRPCTRGPGC